MQSKLIPVKYKGNNNKDKNKVKDGMTPFWFLVTLSRMSLLLKGSFTKTLTYLCLGLLGLLLPPLLLLLPVRRLLLSLFTFSIFSLSPLCSNAEGEKAQEGCEFKLNILKFFSTMKKIIKIACAVIMALYNWLSAMYCTPGPDNSNLINTEKAVPINPENNAKIKYNVPISFALLDKNHLSVQREIEDFLILD